MAGRLLWRGGASGTRCRCRRRSRSTAPCARAPTCALRWSRRRLHRLKTPAAPPSRAPGRWGLAGAILKNVRVAPGAWPGKFIAMPQNIPNLNKLSREVPLAPKSHLRPYPGEPLGDCHNLALASKYLTAQLIKSPKPRVFSTKVITLYGSWNTKKKNQSCMFWSSLYAVDDKQRHISAHQRPLRSSKAIWEPSKGHMLPLSVIRMVQRTKLGRLGCQIKCQHSSAFKVTLG